MKDNQSACFGIKKLENEYTTDYIGYMGEKAIWVSTSGTKSAYCFSEGSVSKGIIARFKIKEQIGLI
jgi:hypothetical protein